MRIATTTARAAAAIVTLAVLVTGGAVSPSLAQSSSDATGDRAPIFDFTDAFYTANGVNPAKLVARRNGTDGLSVVSPAPDRDHRDVRVTVTLPAYDLSGHRIFFTVLADLAPRPFTKDAAGTEARQLAEAAPVYVFPTRDGDPLGTGNNRQADMIDMSNGYFSNNPLGLWVHVFVNWTPKAFDTAAGRQTLRALKAENGAALDGTPIIKTESELDDLTEDGYVTQTKRPTSQQGRYFICPVFKDPRDGAITPDAFLATVRRADGTPLRAERAFVTDFQSLQRTGDYPD